MKKKTVAALVIATTIVTGNTAMAATNDGKDKKSDSNKNDSNVKKSLAVSEAKSTGMYGVINNEDAVISSYIRQDVYRGTNFTMGTIGQVDKGEKVKINYINDSWANITFANKEGKNLTGFIKVDNLKINNLENINKEATINEGERVSIYSDLNGTLAGYVNGKTKVTYNYSYKKWANITFADGNGKVISGFVDSNKLNVNIKDNKRDIGIVGKAGKVINASSVNMRQDGDMNSQVIALIYRNEDVSVNFTKGEWSNVTFTEIDGAKKTGYVKSEYIYTTVTTETTVMNSPNKINNSVSEVVQGKKGQVVNVNTNLRIRQQAGQQYEIMGLLNKSDTFDIIGKEGIWYKIKFNNITGFIHGDYVKELNSSQTVNNDINNSNINNTTNNSNNNSNTNSNTSNNNTNSINDSSKNQNVVLNKGRIINVQSNLRIRSSNDVSSSIIGYLIANDTVDILSKIGGWYKIKFDTYSVKKEGFVKSEYVEEFKEVQSNKSNNGKKVVDESKKYIGTTYLWGGSTPIGFDCSGLTSYVYSKLNINIGRTTWDQIKNGKAVPFSDLQEGDLIFFGSGDNPTNPTHVGMYIGNDQFIHSSMSKKSVTTTKLSQFNMNKIQANRYIK